MDAILFLLISSILGIFALRSVTGKTEEPPRSITGFIDGRLDLVCNCSEPGITVYRSLSENKFEKPQQLKKFVLTECPNDNYSKSDIRVCIPHHSLYNICMSEVTVSVEPAANQAHFIFSKTPSFLHGYETVCEYDSLHNPGERQVIKLRADSPVPTSTPTSTVLPDTTATSTPNTTTSTYETTTSQGKDENGLSSVAIVGIVIGALFACFIVGGVVVGVVIIIRKRKNRDQRAKDVVRYTPAKRTLR